MALTKTQKQEVVSEVKELLETSKLTVVANYQGTTVKELQSLRKQARDSKTKVKVIKNRLVKQALSLSDAHKDFDTAPLNSQLLYAFNSDDEVAPAQVLAKFAKVTPALEFVGAITSEGSFMSADEVKSLASLPSKSQLIATVISTLSAPLNDTMNGLSGDIHGILSGLEAKASS